MDFCRLKEELVSPLPKDGLQSERLQKILRYTNPEEKKSNAVRLPVGRNPLNVLPSPRIAGTTIDTNGETYGVLYTNEVGSNNHPDAPSPTNMDGNGMEMSEEIEHVLRIYDLSADLQNGQVPPPWKAYLPCAPAFFGSTDDCFATVVQKDGTVILFILLSNCSIYRFVLGGYRQGFSVAIGGGIEFSPFKDLTDTGTTTEGYANAIATQEILFFSSMAALDLNTVVLGTSAGTMVVQFYDKTYYSGTSLTGEDFTVLGRGTAETQGAQMGPPASKTFLNEASFMRKFFGATKAQTVLAVGVLDYNTVLAFSSDAKLRMWKRNEKDSPSDANGVPGNGMIRNIKRAAVSSPSDSSNWYCSSSCSVAELVPSSSTFLRVCDNHILIGSKRLFLIALNESDKLIPVREIITTHPHVAPSLLEFTRNSAYLLYNYTDPSTGLVIVDELVHIDVFGGVNPLALPQKHYNQANDSDIFVEGMRDDMRDTVHPVFTARHNEEMLWIQEMDFLEERNADKDFAQAYSRILKKDKETGTTASTEYLKTYWARRLLMRNRFSTESIVEAVRMWCGYTEEKAGHRPFGGIDGSPHRIDARRYQNISGNDITENFIKNLLEKSAEKSGDSICRTAVELIRTVRRIHLERNRILTLKPVYSYAIHCRRNPYHKGKGKKPSSTFCYAPLSVLTRSGLSILRPMDEWAERLWATFFCHRDLSDSGFSRVALDLESMFALCGGVSDEFRVAFAGFLQFQNLMNVSRANLALSLCTENAKSIADILKYMKERCLFSSRDISNVMLNENIGRNEGYGGGGHMSETLAETTDRFKMAESAIKSACDSVDDIQFTFRRLLNCLDNSTNTVRSSGQQDCLEGSERSVALNYVIKKDSRVYSSSVADHSQNNSKTGLTLGDALAGTIALSEAFFLNKAMTDLMTLLDIMELAAPAGNLLYDESREPGSALHTYLRAYTPFYTMLTYYLQLTTGASQTDIKEIPSANLSIDRQKPRIVDTIVTHQLIQAISNTGVDMTRGGDTPGSPGRADTSLGSKDTNMSAASGSPTKKKTLSLLPKHRYDNINLGLLLTQLAGHVNLVNNFVNALPNQGVNANYFQARWHLCVREYPEAARMFEEPANVDPTKMLPYFWPLPLDIPDWMSFMKEIRYLVNRIIKPFSTENEVVYGVDVCKLPAAAQDSPIVRNCYPQVRYGFHVANCFINAGQGKYAYEHLFQIMTRFEELKMSNAGKIEFENLRIIHERLLLICMDLALQYCLWNEAFAMLENRIPPVLGERFYLPKLSQLLRRHGSLGILLKRFPSLSKEVQGKFLDDLVQNRCYRTLYALHMSQGADMRAAYVAWNLYEFLVSKAEVMQAEIVGRDSTIEMETVLVDGVPVCKESKYKELLVHYGTVNNSFSSEGGRQQVLLSSNDAKSPVDSEHRINKLPRKLLEQQKQALLLCLAAKPNQEKLVISAPTTTGFPVPKKGNDEMDLDFDGMVRCADDLFPLPEKNCGNSSSSSDEISSTSKESTDVDMVVSRAFNEEDDGDKPRLSDLRNMFQRATQKAACKIVTTQDLHRKVALLDAKITLFHDLDLSVLPSDPRSLAAKLAQHGLAILSVRLCQLFHLNAWEYALKPFVATVVFGNSNNNPDSIRPVTDNLDVLVDAAGNKATGLLKWMFLRSEGNEPLGTGGKIRPAFWQTIESLVTMLGLECEFLDYILENDPSCHLPAFLVQNVIDPIPERTKTTGSPTNRDHRDAVQNQNASTALQNASTALQTIPDEQQGLVSSIYIERGLEKNMLVETIPSLGSAEDNLVGRQLLKKLISPEDETLIAANKPGMISATNNYKALPRLVSNRNVLAPTGNGVLGGSGLGSTPNQQSPGSANHGTNQSTGESSNSPRRSWIALLRILMKHGRLREVMSLIEKKVERRPIAGLDTVKEEMPIDLLLQLKTSLRNSLRNGVLRGTQLELVKQYLERLDRCIGGL